MATIPRRLTRTKPRPGLWEFDLVSRAWRLFSSMHLALVLILVIAGVVLVGTLVDQAPPPVIADRVAYEQWLERARTKYGGWTGTFDRLQLFNVFHALYFRALLALLSINIIVCSINRWHGVWTTVFHTRVRMTPAFFRHARFGAQLAVATPAPRAAQQLRRTLSRAHYHVKTDITNGSIALFADKNRLSRFGTFFAHLSIVLILAGAIVGGVWGFKDPEFVVSEGSTRHLGMGTGIAIRLDHFADEYYLDGPPKDFRSDVTVLDNGKPVKQATIRVNSPLRYKGIAFHQAFYGQTAVVKVQDSAGKVLFSDGVPLAWQTREGGRPVGSFNLAAEDLSVYVVGPRAGETDPLVPAGEMRVELYRQGIRAAVPQNLSQGRPTDLAGLTFTFERESRFTGLKVVKDPGVNIIWVASGLMVLGMIMLFYLPRRRLWALCNERPDGTTEVLLGMPAQRDQSLSGEFERLRLKIAHALRALPPGSDPEGGRHD